jgi:hypothetical protein
MSSLRSRATSLALRIAVPTLALATACSQPAGEPTAALDPAMTAHGAHDRRDYPEVTQGHLNAAARVKEATAVFRNIQAAVGAGYTVQFPAGCAALANVGAQGFHYLDPVAAGDAKLDLLHPELVMYEPQANGSLVLVGVDYVIPFAEWKAPQPPVLLGMPLMRNEPLQVWALHIWTERANPDGLFAAWNPAVSCQHAGAANLPTLP